MMSFAFYPFDSWYCPDAESAPMPLAMPCLVSRHGGGEEWSPTKKKSWQERISSTIGAYESFTKIICGEKNYPKDVENGSLDQVLTRNIFKNNENLVQFREGDNVLRSGDLRGDGYGNAPQMDREYKGDLNLLKPVTREYRPNDIVNKRRSGGTCGTTYWITQVRHEAADAESAPMPLAMPCLVPWYGGGSQRGTTRPYSQQGGWHYWQRPSGENAVGAKRGRPAPGEHREEREPGRWKSQGRPGHLTEMEGFGL
nr:NADH dehydrogenase [ubiquinone] iron-sulfur protein 2 [Tanacetum cinerariifolium]